MTTTLTNAEKATIYREAAQGIHERGWTKGCFEQGPGGPMCIAGAVGYAAMGEALYACSGKAHDLNMELATIMHERLGFDGCIDCYGDPWPAEWNNEIAEDADEVIHVLKMAAEEIELLPDAV